MSAALLAAAWALACAAPTAAAPPGAPLFAEDGVLEITLNIDSGELCRPRETEDCGFTPTTLEYVAGPGQAGTLPVQVKVRGGWRSLTRNCAVPLLWVQFDPAAAVGTPFEGQDLLPLTTHCGKGASIEYSTQAVRRSDFEQYLLREYLGHRVYNGLSELSLRTRLARVRYRESSALGRPPAHYGFFTEHFDALASRAGAERPERGSFEADSLDAQSAAVLALFQFMIGNTDWSIARERNTLLLLRDGRQLPVPYDLDMSGLVDAHYAGPAPGLPIDGVRDRYFLGYCQPGTDWDALLTHFLDARDRVLAMPGTIPGLSRKSLRAATRFLEGFYAILANPEAWQGQVVTACQPWPPSGNDHTSPQED